MDTSAALDVTDRWYVADTVLDPDARQLTLDFRRRSRFACLDCGATGCPVHDTAERRWRHLNFFEYRTELVTQLPRVRSATMRCAARRGPPRQAGNRGIGASRGIV